MEILCPLWAYLTPLMVKQNNFLLISNQDFHVPTCFLCLSVAVHLSECRKLQRAIMCLLSALFLMLSKPSSCCLSCIPYSLSPPILVVSTGLIPLCQYLLLARPLLNFGDFPSSHVSSLSQPLSTAALPPTYLLLPLSLLTSTILLRVHFVFSCICIDEGNSQC